MSLIVVTFCVELVIFEVPFFCTFSLYVSENNNLALHNFNSRQSVAIFRTFVHKIFLSLKSMEVSATKPLYLLILRRPCFKLEKAQHHVKQIINHVIVRVPSWLSWQSVCLVSRRSLVRFWQKAFIFTFLTIKVFGWFYVVSAGSRQSTPQCQ
ncbi:hypothetical protein K501DRAFT_272382 [Backusella circina FSU 941]|nr:hypothetical protein K501DRAFT_272382 [Backusella circina FSU 941]